MAHIAIVTLDSFTDKMAGPAIRVWEMARVLSEHNHHVRVLTFSQAQRHSSAFTLHATDVPSFRQDLGEPDIVIIQGFLIQTFPWLGDSSFRLVVDLYDPFHLESLEVEKNQPMTERLRSLTYALRELDGQTRVGDFFVCANERQRDFWLGQLAGCGRLSPALYDNDPSMRSLIDIAPFGIAETDPIPNRRVVKGVIPGISESDKLIVWGGGIYNWFDPLTVIRAVDKARHTIPNVRLLFMGAKHPNPDVPAMKMAAQARALVAELSLDEHVFFNEEWVEYADRHNYLCEADIAVSAHFPGIETDFSFRTRMLDYMWTARPIVCTEGDYFARLVERENVGRAVPCGDADAMARAFIELLTNDDMREDMVHTLSRVAQEYRWSRTLEPIVRYCENPWETSEKTPVTYSASLLNPKVFVIRASSLAARTAHSVRDHGVKETGAHIRRFLQKKMQRR